MGFNFLRYGEGPVVVFAWLRRSKLMILSNLSSILVEVLSNLSSRVLMRSGDWARLVIVSWNDLNCAWKFKVSCLISFLWASCWVDMIFR